MTAQSVLHSSEPSVLQSILTPASLLQSLLEAPRTSIPELCAHFHCSLDDLLAILETSEFLKHIKLQTQLAYIQSRLAASRHLPDALQETIAILHNSEKPEVRRRAAASLIQIAGIPIRTQSQSAPPPIFDPDDADTGDDGEDASVFAAQIAARDLSDEGLKFNDLAPDDLLNGMRALYLASRNTPQELAPAEEEKSVDAVGTAARQLLAEGIHLEVLSNDQLLAGLRDLYIAKRGHLKPKIPNEQ